MCGRAPGVIPRPSTVVTLLLLGLTLSAAVALRLAPPSSEDDNAWFVPEAGGTRPAVEAGSAPVPNTDPVHDILERPLFQPGRRLPSALRPLLGAPPLPEPAGRLVGVVIGPDRRGALFAEADDRITTVKQGGILQGWTVQTIEPDRVILVSAQGQRTVSFVPDPIRAATPMPAGPAVAAPAGKNLWQQILAPTPLDSATTGQPNRGQPIGGQPAARTRRAGEAR